MIKKISVIYFIFLLLFLINAVSALNCENETASVNIEDLNEINYEKIETQQYEKNTEKLSSSNTEPTKEKVTLTAPNVNMYYKDGTKFTATLKDKNKKAISNAKVNIRINGVTYTKTTDKKGTIMMDINLRSGKYSILTSFDGTNNYEKQSSQSTINIKSTIKCGDLKKIYKNSAPYTATFYDKKGNLIKNTAIKFQINGNIYSVKSNKNGVGKININLKPGTYSITSINSKTSESIMKTITITPLILENNDLTKYYKNGKEFKVKIIDSNGKTASNGKQVSFTINGKTYTMKTDKNGYAKMAINLKPGQYTIKTTYDGCSLSNKILIKSLIETKDLTMNETDDAKFNVKILNSDGKTVPNQKVTLKLNGKTYTKTTDSNGIASIDIDLDVGKYTITSEYSNLKSSNIITVNNVMKPSNFIHSIMIPDYVNVTIPYVFQNAKYSLKTGFNGIVKLPKYELFTIKVGHNYYQFSANKQNGADYLDYSIKSYLIPFDGSEIKSSYNKDNLKGNGIIISKISDYTQIDYVGTTTDNVELFGFYADKGAEQSETITYMKNDEEIAKISFVTYEYDEYGLKYSLNKYYGNINKYTDLPNEGNNIIKFINTGESVTFNYFGRTIVGYPSKEEIITKFTINDREELEKKETISYGRSKNYQKSFGFEVLQSYAIISEKISCNKIEAQLTKNSAYLDRFGVMNVYAMYLAAIETCWLADELANAQSNEFDLTWKRNRPIAILGGSNLDTTYLHILNSDMGMDIKGSNPDNILLFRLVNSLYLPNLEKYALSEIEYRFFYNSTSSLENMLLSMSNANFTICYLDDLIYLLSEDGLNSTIIINKTSGIANILLIDNDFAYKGASIKTSEDCCSVGILVKDVIVGIRNALKTLSASNNAPLKSSDDIINKLSNKLRDGIKIGYNILNFGKPLIVLAGSTISVGFSLITLMVGIQELSVKVKNTYVDKEDWYSLYDTVTFARPGLLQNRKIYNIPNNNGGYDYIEIPIKDDLSLDRDNALYISKGNVRNMTRTETYEYFESESWTPFSIPTKYMHPSWRRILGG